MGCGEGELDGAKLSREIEASLKKQENVATVEVKCPAKIEREVGAKFSCPVVTDKEAGLVRVVVQDKEGSVRWQVDSKATRPL